MIVTIDLHTLRHKPAHTMQEVVEAYLDHKIAPRLQRKRDIELHIIVGRGLNSIRLIKGVHPIKYYTEMYLQKLALMYKTGSIWANQDGIIIVRL